MTAIIHIRYSLHRVKTLAAWTGGATVIGLYLTDWKVVMGKVPYVRRRFDNND